MTRPARAEIVVVTGLPRSGTSLMMQLLAAAGLPILADDQRAPDDDNPHGYLEDARVKSLQRDHSWLGEARGRALKVVSPLLQYLPPEHRYVVVWMERDLSEVLASQARMLERAGHSPGDDDALRRGFERQASAARKQLERYATRILPVGYASAIANAGRTAREVCAFLGGELDAAAAAAAVEPALYRQRS